MKKTKYLLPLLILPTITNSFDLSSLKKTATDIGSAIYKNISKKEEKLPTFSISGTNMHSSREIIDLGLGRVNYDCFLDRNTLYLSINPKKEISKERAYENYLSILEGTDLFLSIPYGNEIKTVGCQGNFIKQNPFDSKEIEITKKALLSLEDHCHAKEILTSAESSLEGIVSFFGKTAKNKFNEFTNNSQKKYLEEVRKKIDPYSERQTKMIPLGNPDKLFGQKLSSIEYKITFKNTPENISIYHLINLEETNKKLPKTIHIRKH